VSDPIAINYKNSKKEFKRNEMFRCIAVKPKERTASNDDSKK